MNLNKKTIISIFIGLVLILSINLGLRIAPFNSIKKDAEAQNGLSQTYFKAKITDIFSNSQQETSPGMITVTQGAKALILDGEDKNKEVEIKNTYTKKVQDNRALHKNEDIILAKVQVSNDLESYTIVDKYRLDGLTVVITLFILILLVVLGRKSLGSILGLILSVVILIFAMLPLILNGYNILLVGLGSVLAIAFLTIFLAHGFNKKSGIAVLAVISCILILANLSLFFVQITNLFGVGSSESMFLQVSQNYYFNLQAMLIVAILISSVGILDDVASSQVATIYELSKANPELSTIQLYKRGMNVGREHIASMVNSLVLIYVGAALPLFILFFSDQAQSWLVRLNYESIAQDIVVSLAISICLILAVPITTFTSAVFLKKN